MKKIYLCSFVIIMSFFIFVACADSDINLDTVVDNGGVSRGRGRG